MMNVKNLLSALALTAFAFMPFSVNAGNIDANAARATANTFLKQQSARVPGFKAAAMSDLTLAHAEASKAVAGANNFYAFNIKGGGFIIIAGEDRAPQVLGYSDKGQLDFKNLPYGLKGLLGSYSREIEFLQLYEGDDLVPANLSDNGRTGVDPLIMTTWGQEDPYDWQCPVKNGEYCVVGCVATAMAQVMYYWKYPESSDALPSFYSSGYGRVSALPATTFDYNKMLLSYCHWDYSTSTLVQDTYTDEQAQEVAKLGRYCGQAVEMSYSPDGSGAYTWNQLDAMINFGYRSSAEDVQKDGWFSSSYTTAEWEAMMKTELDAGRPILYSASDTQGAGGHAFICDGYNTDGKFHFNFGWYGTCDGWYVSTALNMTHRDGDYLRFNSGHEMLIGVEPPEGWVPPVTFIRGDVNNDGVVDIADVPALIDYMLFHDGDINLDAADCNQDNEVTISDVSALVDYLLNQSW